MLIVDYTNDHGNKYTKNWKLIIVPRSNGWSEQGKIGGESGQRKVLARRGKSWQRRGDTGPYQRQEDDGDHILQFLGESNGKAALSWNDESRQEGAW